MHRLATFAFLSLACLAAAPLVASPLAAAEEGFVPLFDGKTLDGWEQHGGKAKYEVVDGMIVGSSVPNTPNSFLCTKLAYANFVLEYEFKVDSALNSGVQFRAEVFPDARSISLGDGKEKKMEADRVHGYQCEIDPNKPDRMWTGGIYDEARRGWLYPGPKGGDPAEFTKVGQKSYKPEEWNSVRIEANGPHIKSFLNGVARADFEDDLTPTGIIALQVHGVGGQKETLQARWRNLRIKTLD